MLDIDAPSYISHTGKSPLTKNCIHVGSFHIEHVNKRPCLLLLIFFIIIILIMAANIAHLFMLVNEEVGGSQRGKERLPGCRRRLVLRQIPKAISQWAVAGGSRASIGSSSPQTNLLAGSLSILTDQSIQAHPLNDVLPAQGRDTLVRAHRWRASEGGAGLPHLVDFYAAHGWFFYNLKKT